MIELARSAVSCSTLGAKPAGEFLKFLLLFRRWVGPSESIHRIGGEYHGTTRVNTSAKSPISPTDLVEGSCLPSRIYPAIDVLAIRNAKQAKSTESRLWPQQNSVVQTTADSILNVSTSYRFLSWMSGLLRSGTNVQVATTTEPTFPEDIERTINEVVLNDTRDMCGTMSLVASRFHAWTKPIMFHTVIVRPRKNSLQRISESLLPNTNLIRILVLDLDPGLSAEESSYIRRLLECSHQVRHLAVTWNIWVEFERECGALQLQSLYLFWDGDTDSPRPFLRHLQYPSALKDFTVYAPDRLGRPGARFREPFFYLPPMTQDFHLRTVMFVHVDVEEEECVTLVKVIRQQMQQNPNFSTAYLRFSSQVLVEWVAKMEGRPSMLQHPPPRTRNGVFEG
ncbi:hypothetical protein DFH07DRAFT_783058 [Mycena maculata]|uniref:Uncharacterized protein n=1 Tax=Mycena maculata TaxID=230809 RepID=A0AAD7HPC9_9AGAR|nr:hypothetical protein DFH07DRAFT_783058 [Mycena maculata]